MTGTAKRTWAVMAGTATVLAVLFAAMIFGGVGAESVPGLPAAGPGVEYGLGVWRLISNVSGAVTVGALLGALLTFDAAGDDKRLRRRFVSVASAAATLWTGASLLQVVYSYADFAAMPLSEALQFERLIDFVKAVSQAQALAVQAAFASVLTALCVRMRSAKGIVACLLLAVVALLPPALTGHSAAAGSHSLGVSTLSLHVVAATLWLGGVVVLAAISFGKAGNQTLVDAASRFSKLAFWCFVSVAISGVANAALRVESPGQLFTTHYGVLVLVKVVALIAIAIMGHRHRQITLQQLRDGRNQAFKKLVAVEAVVLTATFAVAVALSRSAPPYDPDASTVSPARLVLGYDLPPPPTLLRYFTEFQPDGYAIIFAAFGIALYLKAVRHLKARGRHWPLRNTIAWISGWLLVVFITSSGLGVYSGVLFSAHMAQHMVLNMIAPILLVLGEPITLAIRSLPRSAVKGQVGLREWASALLRSRGARFLTSGVVAGAIFVASLWILYFTPLFEAAMGDHFGHVLMQVHFLASGFLFFYVLLGRDVSAKRFPYPARFGLLVMTMISHAFFGVALMSRSTVIAETYYESLQRPWLTSLIADQRTGAGIAWGFGELPITLVLIVLFFRWIKSEERAAASETEAVS